MNVRQRIRSGIRLLDKAFPDLDWRKKIDHNTLNMANPRLCVLGQLYEDFAFGILELDMAGGSYEYGFCDDSDYNELTEIWKEELTHSE